MSLVDRRRQDPHDDAAVPRVRHACPVPDVAAAGHHPWPPQLRQPPVSVRSSDAYVDSPAVNDSELLDGVQDLSLLSDRQLLERLVRATERIENQMTVDEDYLKAAMSSLDVQFANLQIRVQGYADQITQAAAQATDFQSLKETVNSVADKIQADAVTMSNMAQPSAVADPANPATTTEVPTDPTTPIPPADTAASGSTSAPAAETSTPAVDEPPAPGSGDEPAPFTS